MYASGSLAVEPARCNAPTRPKPRAPCMNTSTGQTQASHRFHLMRSSRNAFASQRGKKTKTCRAPEQHSHRHTITSLATATQALSLSSTNAQLEQGWHHTGYTLGNLMWPFSHLLHPWISSLTAKRWASSPIMLEKTNYGRTNYKQTSRTTWPAPSMSSLIARL